MSRPSPDNVPARQESPAPLLLLTGRPGVGKTTLVRHLVVSLGEAGAAGFYTEEIRDHEGRVGFRAMMLNGRSMVMAHVHIRGPARVGKYGVDLDVLTEMADTVLGAAPDARLLVVDEIGKMECLAPRFVAAIRAVVGGTRPVVATIGMRGVPLLDELRRRPGVTLWEVTAANRDQLATETLRWVADALRGRPG